MQPINPLIEPFLWIVAAGRPTTILKTVWVGLAAEWPEGVYFFGDELFRTGIVVASELPRERSTLLVRLMAGGPLLPQAIRELAALPPDAPERAVAEQILLNLQHVLDQRPRRTREEQEFIMTMQNTWENARTEGRAEGRTEGRTEGTARAVLAVLRVRGIAVPDAVRDLILAQKDPKRLETWHERAVVAASVAEVIDEPS